MTTASTITLPSERYKAWQQIAAAQAAEAEAATQPATPLPVVPKGDPLILSLAEQRSITSLEPVSIFSGEITLNQPCRLLFNGHITAHSTGLFGVALYLNDQPLFPSAETAVCHPDCSYTVSGEGLEPYQAVISINLFSPLIIQPGTHQVRLAALSVWEGQAINTWINQLIGNEALSTTRLTVQPL